VTEDELDVPHSTQGIAISGANHVDGKQKRERLIAHELAHQWFGGSITPRTWQHVWLNEGFATYAEWLWSEASGGASIDRLAAKPGRISRSWPMTWSSPIRSLSSCSTNGSICVARSLCTSFTASWR